MNGASNNEISLLKKDFAETRIRKNRASYSYSSLDASLEEPPSNRFEGSKAKASFNYNPIYRCRRCQLGKCLFLVLLFFPILALHTYYTRLMLDPCRIARSEIESFRIIDSSDFVLPKIIHQQWKTDDIPQKYSNWVKKWKELFPEPEYKHMLWSDKAARKLLTDHFPWFLPTYDGFKHNIQRADSIRYFILFHYGGLYADLDYEPLENFWKALPRSLPSLIESPYKYNENAQNSLMASPKAHPFWKITFDIMRERGKSESVLTSTGPSMLDEAFYRSKKNGTSYYLLPCANFHRIPFGKAGKSSPFMSKLGREIFGRLPLVKQCGDWKSQNTCQYGIHHNAVSWADQSLV